jgi:hypothetical protein
VTNVRRIAGTEREPGSVMVASATALLALLAGGLLYVSYAAQYQYIFHAKHQSAPSVIEALMLDCGMIIFSLLGLGLSRAGKSSRVERALIMVCAGLSALMNGAAADTASPRSIAAYVAAPAFLAIVVDRVIAVIRRHVLADDERSVWSGAGRAVLYVLRFVLDPWATVKGGRRAVLAAAPLPELEAPERKAIEPPEDTAPPTKKAALLALYRQHEAYGDRLRASKVAAELAARAGLQAGSARTYIYAELADVEASA